LTAQCEVVEAFLAATRDGDFDALVAVLDPDVVLRGDAGGLSDLSRRVQGARAVAGQALYWSQIRLTTRRALGNGAPGTVSFREGKPFSVGAFSVTNGKIVEIDFLADLERIAQFDLTLLGD
jgi:ketosteroid isomerase-like protein